jgi:hypothetical protein
MGKISMITWTMIGVAAIGGIFYTVQNHKNQQK